jgi:predicted kinase
MPEGSITLTRGIPASGKTTAARDWVKEKPEQRIRVNRDELRRMLHGIGWGLTYPQEEAITTLQQNIVRAALAEGRDVIVDDMNLRAKYVRAWFAFSPNVTFWDFPIDTEEAVARDALREHSVGADVVRTIASKFTRHGDIVPPPSRDVETPLEVLAYVPDDTLDPAYIVDIDGTLAHIPAGGRDPYDGSRVDEDILDTAVARVIRTLEVENHIVIMSGRDEEYREVTEAWLLDNNVRYDRLYMRPAGDKRKDHIVKLELFDRHVRGAFDVQGVFDDRNRVVEMWRSIGLKCFHVQEGNF